MSRRFEVRAHAQKAHRSAPHRGDEKLFWDEDNWQPLCERCHAKKTARGE